MAASKTSKIEPTFDENALVLLNKRYLMKDAEGVVCETPKEMLERCSFGDPDFYELMARRWFFPNTPTLVNAGTGRPASFSACFKFTVPDDLHEIGLLVSKQMDVLKWGGGVGFSFEQVRPRGSRVMGTNGTAGGTLAWMRVFQATAKEVEQGGVRPGAQMAILPWDHGDIWDFVTSKNTQEKADALNTFNISVAAEDRLMGRVSQLFAQKHGMSINWDNIEEWDDEFRLFLTIVDGAWRTGDPGCYFIDASERTNPTPWLWPLTGTNPCGEVPLGDNEPCNLGSINLMEMLKPLGRGQTNGGPWRDYAQIDWERLEWVTRTATRFLDTILDNNQFAHPDITKAAQTTRKLGLGVMGLGDMFVLMGVPYNSTEALNMSAEISKNINKWSLEESVTLAKAKGHAPAYDALESVGPEHPAFNHPMTKWALEATVTGNLPRNTTRTCIAPTGSISILAGVMSGIEPHFAETTYRYMADGTMLPQTWPAIDMAKSGRGRKPDVYANDIIWYWHVQHQAAWQENVDLACSKTINMPNTATREDIAGAYIEAWRSGCKGITVFRDGSRNFQVLNKEEREGGEEGGNGRSTARHFAMAETYGLDLTNATEEQIQGALARFALDMPPLRRPLPDTRRSITHKVYVGEQKAYITVGMYEDGQPGELFIKCDREGSTVSGLLESFGIMTSKALQYGVPLEDICSKLKGMRFEPSGFTSNPQIRTATSLIDYVVRWLMLEFRPEEKEDPVTVHTLQCPNCGGKVESVAGCLQCAENCGWSRCG